MFNGITYKPGQIAIISSNLLPQFGMIADIIILDTDNIVIILEKLHTTAFISHFHCYEILYVQPTEYILMKPSEFVDLSPLSLYKPPNHNFVSLKYYVERNNYIMYSLIMFCLVFV